MDFGYQGTGSISDFVWNDIDGDGVQDAGEGGIGGVTVWVDLDNDGVQDPTEPSDVTDANGLYYIGGLSANASAYTVRVTPSGSPINGATATYDLDGAGTPNVASVTLTAGQNRTDVDWGYQFAALSTSPRPPARAARSTRATRSTTPSSCATTPPASRRASPSPIRCPPEPPM